MKAGEKLILPLWFRVGIVGMILTTLCVSFTYKLTEQEHKTAQASANHGQAIVSQSLHFVDLEGGLISVIDADKDQEITQLNVGEDGFMRSVMRGLARERMAKGHGQEIPFELTVWENGLVSLLDPVTQRQVELSAFGKDNVAAFTRLLPDASSS